MRSTRWRGSASRIVGAFGVMALTAVWLPAGVTVTPAMSRVAAAPSQAASGPPASIRPSTRTAANRTWFLPATLVATGSNPNARPGSTVDVVVANGVTLREMIGFAYMNERGAITRSQILGAPSWADTQRFDIVLPGTAGQGLTYNADQIANGGSALPQLQQLLSERFQLRIRTDQRTLPAMDLVAMSGDPTPDLRRSTASCVQSDPAQSCTFVAGPGFVTVRGMTMGHLAMQLSWNFPAITLPVRDRTGLTGKYDYTLSFVPAFLAAPNPRVPNVANPSAGTGLSLAQALEARLGLRLVEVQDQFDVVIVDAVQPLK